jgi:molybdopterin converting factor small subunit
MKMLSASSLLKADAACAPSALRVLFFGPVRTQLGVEDFSLACPEEMSVEELWSKLSERFIALKTMRPTIRLARGGEFLEPSARIHPGDEIALIPPVSGG